MLIKMLMLVQEESLTQKQGNLIWSDPRQILKQDPKKKEEDPV